MSQVNSPIVPSVGAVAIADGRVLLVRQEEESGHINGMYGFPAGRVEKGETELEAVVREFREETGLIAKPFDFSQFPNNYFVTDIPRKNNQVITFGFRAYKVTNFIGELAGEANKTTPEWIKLEDLEQLEKDGKLLPNTIKIVNQVLQ